MRSILVWIAITISFVACKGEANIFTFCRDFSADTCIEPLQQSATFDLRKTVQNKTLREFYNSVYFRGDRLAFALNNASARKPVDFECLHGRYSFSETNAEHFELEYIELRENNVYGLVMLGSMIEKLVGAKQNQKYKPLPPFRVTYEVYCGKYPLAKRTISVELK